MLRSGPTVLLISQLLGSCAVYHPAPLDLPATLRDRATRGPDPAAVRVELERIAPDVAWDGQTWDRLSLLALALVENPRIAEARAHALSEAARAEVARSGPPVTLTLVSEYAREAPESSPWLYGLVSDVPIDAGGRRTGRIASASYSALAARYDYAEVAWSVRSALRQALVEQRLTSREIDIGERLAVVRQRQVDALKARLSGGEIVRAELLRVEAEAAADSRRLSDARARKVAADTAVAAALGIAREQVVNMTVAWDDFRDPDAELSAIGPTNKPANKSRTVQDYETALLARSDVLRAVASYDQAEAELRAEVARQWPEIHVAPGYIWERGLVKLPFAIGLVLPPGDLNRSAIAAAEARRLEAGVHLDALVSEAQVSIDAAVSESAAALAALGQVRDIELPAAQATAKSADAEIRLGAVDRAEWAAAQTLYYNSELGEIDALRRAQTSLGALEDALRRPLEGPEQAMVAGPEPGRNSLTGITETLP